MRNAVHNTTAINKAIKKHIVNLMRGNGKLKYTKKITRNDDLFFECTVTVVSESTCEIGEMNTTRFSVDFDKFVSESDFFSNKKFEERISLIQLN
tara:strand:- start:5 stop:289 length:285 start_codon:yes stop_codon:yes gene_type:complete